VRLAVVQVVPLIGEQHAVLFGLAQLVGETACDVLVVVRVAVGQRRHFDQFRAAKPQHVFLFLALRVRDHDHRAVAARACDQREPDAGVAGGAFDHKPARLEIAAPLGLQDHLASRTIFHRTAGVHELGFAQDQAPGGFGGLPQLDQRRIANGFDGAVAGLHFKNTIQFGVRNLVDAQGGHKATPIGRITERLPKPYGFAGTHQGARPRGDETRRGYRRSVRRLIRLRPLNQTLDMQA